MAAGMMGPDTTRGAEVDEETAKGTSATVYLGDFYVSLLFSSVEYLLTPLNAQAEQIL